MATPWDCFVATTPRNDRRGVCHCEPFLFVIASPFYLSLRAERGNPRKAKLKNQRTNREGFYLLICHLNFLSLIFDIVQDFPAGCHCKLLRLRVL